MIKKVSPRWWCLSDRSLRLDQKKEEEAEK